MVAGPHPFCNTDMSKQYFNFYIILELHSSYFPRKLDIALTVWNMYVIVGLAWQAGWSTSLCVSTKIYFQIGLLCFSILCYSEYFCNFEVDLYLVIAAVSKSYQILVFI